MQSIQHKVILVKIIKTIVKKKLMHIHTTLYFNYQYRFYKNENIYVSKISKVLNNVLCFIICILQSQYLTMK